MEIRNRFTGALLASTPAGMRNFSDENLTNADLRGHVVTHGDFHRTRLVGADIRDIQAAFVNFSEADFRLAKLANGNFRHAVFTDANFRGADLRGANFTGAQMARVDFTGADIRGTNFKGASLARSKGLRDAIGIDEILSIPQGQLIGYKKIHDVMGNSCIAFLDIPIEARRVRAIGASAVRADRARVVRITREYDGAYLESGYSMRDPHFLYVVGKLATCERPFDDDITLECSSGIHFYLDLGDLS